MKSRHFDISISCASCKGHIDAVLKNYPNLKYSVNIMEKLLKVEADEATYPDEKIEELVKQAGYTAERI